VNIVPLEQYVSGVVPNESPAGWGTLGGPGPQGQPWGFQELEAQAVAARSFVMAGLGSYGGYADVCDLACQNYRGLQNETAVSDLAVTNTGGEVMEPAGGAVASTQYSASTGGFTAPGAFPAVPDAGDSVCVPGACNPNHTWSTSIPVSGIEAAWPQLGTLEAVHITSRNGFGEWGGRVTAMTLVGSASNVSLSGDAFAGSLGLKSDWFTVGTAITAPAVGMAPTPDGKGYWVVGRNGSLFAFGDATFEGSADGLVLNEPIVGMAATAGGKGYWLVASDGGIFGYGDAHFYGSTGNLVLNKPVVGMVATPDGHGYWLVAADGGIFSYGDAAFYGSTGSLVLNRPVVGMAATPDGKGYWLVASDGGVFAFGDARFFGSMGGQQLNRPVVGMSTIPGGDGYRLVASDGGVFSFGRALFYGSTGSLHLVRPVVGMAGTATGSGYWMVAADGGIFAFGDAGFYGSAAG
jgi:SpoIID/LytB domain protein